MERRVVEVGRGRWMNPAITTPTPDFRKRKKKFRKWVVEGHGL